MFQGERAKVGRAVAGQGHAATGERFPEDDDPACEAEIQAFYDQLPAVEHEGHDGQIANFLAPSKAANRCWSTAPRAARTLELITAIYQSGHLGGKVALPLTPSDPFYTRDGILRTRPALPRENPQRRELRPTKSLWAETMANER